MCSGCENVNREMVRQVQKHEELVRALAALKDTNRRLVEQIRRFDLTSADLVRCLTYRQ